MNQIGPITKYPGEDITCFPGSNQEDDGKINLEFNCARYVTRVSSKNFCIIKPSFDLSAISDIVSGKPKLRIETGQASINGMDLIMTKEIIIDPPEQPGEWHVAFKLARDSSWNVLGDFTYGVTKTFEGVYLAYYDEKPDPMDPDMLYLGKVTWDGSKFTEVIEDEDKYGRIWAEDVMCKVLDPKHPDYTRLNLQEYLYKLPDWYFSKEGDIIYGPLVVADNRENGNAGFILNVTKNGTTVVVKDPAVDNNKILRYGDINQNGTITQSDVDLVQAYVNGTGTLTDLQKILADVNNDGVIDNKDVEYISNYIKGEGNPGYTGAIYSILPTINSVTTTVNKQTAGFDIGTAKFWQDLSSRILTMYNPVEIFINSDTNIRMLGKNKVELGTNNDRPKLTLANDVASFTDSIAPALTYDIKFIDANNIQQTFGKAIWQYNASNQYVSLLQNNVTYLEIVPNTLFRNNARVQNTLYIGGSDTDTTTPQTTLQRDSFWLRENVASNGRTLNITSRFMTFINPQLSSSVNSYIQLQNNANTVHTRIEDKGRIELLSNSTSIGNPRVDFKDGTSTYDCSIWKTIGAKTLNIDASLTNFTGNIVATGTITGSKVYNAVYNDAVEFMKKEYPDEEIAKGEIVCFTDNGNVTKARYPGDIERLAGIVSSEETFGYALGGDGLADNEKVPVALIGRVWVKVEDKNIKTGDKLTIDETGNVVKADIDCRYIIGMATKKPENGYVWTLVK